MTDVRKERQGQRGTHRERGVEKERKGKRERERGNRIRKSGGAESEIKRQKDANPEESK